MSAMGAILGSISGSGTAHAALTTVLATSPASTRAPGGRRGALAALLLALPLCLGAAPVTRLDIGIEGMRSAKGNLLVCLTADPANFPGCVDDRNAVLRTVPARERDIRFDALPAGTYAASVIHDENGNARLDTFAGIPKEGFGFSRNPALRFGPPRFSAAKFQLSDDAGKQQVRMRYIF